MKIQITTLIVLLTCQVSVSQVFRYADLKVEFTSPSENTIVHSPGLRTFQFKIVNNGPDTIFQGDSILYSPSHSYSKTTTERKQAFRKTLAPNDSVFFSDSIKINARAFNKNFYLAFAQVPMSFGPDNGKLYLQNEFSEDRWDNKDQVKLFHTGNLSKTADIKYSDVLIYPNPVHNGSVHVSGSERIESIHLLNEFGQKVNIQLVRVNNKTYSINTNAIASGVYFARIKTTEGMVTEKLLIL